MSTSLLYHAFGLKGIDIIHKAHLFALSSFKVRTGFQLEKYMVKHRKPPSPTWQAFWDNHVKDFVSINFFVVPTIRNGERLIGSIRRECLDHIIVLNLWHLRRILASYFDYYHHYRTNLSLDSDCPMSRPVQPEEMDNVIKKFLGNEFLKLCTIDFSQNEFSGRTI